MKSCVIGGGGFIGSHLVGQLLASGRQVLVLGRRKERPSDLPQGAQYISGSYGERELLRTIFRGVDEIYDLAYATVPKSSFEDPVFDIVGNLPSSVALLEEASLMPGLRRLLIVSSGGVVYGPSKALPITESCTTNPISPYGITKLTIEKYALMFHRLRGLPVTILRPSNAYGKGQRPFTGQGFIATAMGLILKNMPVPVFGTQGTIRDYIHVRDVASGIIAAANYGEAGEIYNIGSGIGLDNLSVLHSIEKFTIASGKTLIIDVKPERDFDVPINVLSFDKLAACSSWSPTILFEDGLREMWESIYIS